jgi:hypothetical protein
LPDARRERPERSADPLAFGGEGVAVGRHAVVDGFIGGQKLVFALERAISQWAS